MHSFNQLQIYNILYFVLLYFCTYNIRNTHIYIYICVCTKVQKYKSTKVYIYMYNIIDLFRLP